MGLWISRLMARFGEREERILMLGLDAAGKTTVVRRVTRVTRVRVAALARQRNPLSHALHLLHPLRSSTT